MSACGSDSKNPKQASGPRLSAKDNKGVAGIGQDVSTYCYKGGAHANVERAVEELLTAYRAHPTAIFRASTGTESTMREVVTAVAQQLETCDERALARKLRTELTKAG
ncbi:MAG: hypothetical protein QOI98_1639 [Solirubrobacteraceae bacterium]|nr:hypothetical protein [Solirubrobacteraceae bacterium]